MVLAHSKVAAQGRITVLAEVRRKLGISAGSVLEWDEHGEMVVVLKVERYSSKDVHHALFPNRRTKKSRIEALDEGIRRYMKTKHGSR